ncbi:hypothetical protein LX32DRAFT_637477 [Colletotrichum zoysiae]|uniref:Uncharacterized protein n=1 Tax=Colletotrichum zoysiae TaxID=1216348 RepID=A0AAD9HLE9_9PEZI|nr:hypothetical protein LX32DRAFT_637477 [Colletotrichum zoysiae]
MQQSPLSLPGRSLESGIVTPARPATSTSGTAQPSRLRVKHGDSTFRSNITLTGDASAIQGNKITGITQGGVNQEGSEFSGDMRAEDKGRVSQGNQITAEKADWEQAVAQ